MNLRNEIINMPGTAESRTRDQRIGRDDPREFYNSSLRMVIRKPISPQNDEPSIYWSYIEYHNYRDLYTRNSYFSRVSYELMNFVDKNFVNKAFVLKSSIFWSIVVKIRSFNYAIDNRITCRNVSARELRNPFKSIARFMRYNRCSSCLFHLGRRGLKRHFPHETRAGNIHERVSCTFVALSQRKPRAIDKKSVFSQIFKITYSAVGAHLHAMLRS